MSDRLYTETEVTERERAAFVAGAFYAELAFYADTLPSPDAFPATTRAEAAKRYGTPRVLEFL